ncbi:MAG: hypothetical protein APR54_11195 [Candidatus Cloacimonas sp. SDB]|nr:MAG: hypothetical protein APR54_11195 [Candidatus Cloacimonas sp. SDB]
MNKKLLVVMVSLVLIGMISTVAAENNHLFPWMRMGLGARGMAMGGTGTAHMNNITAVYWNPAALGNIKRAEFAGMYTDMGLDRNHNFAALGVPFKYGYVALSWIQAGVSDIAGSQNYNSTGNFTANDHSISLSLALGTGRFKVGFTPKMYLSKIDDDSQSGFGTDLGFLWDINDYISMGVTLRDLYSELDGEEVPAQYNLGLAIRPIWGLTFATDLKTEKHTDEEVYVSIGAEYWTGAGKDTEVGSSYSAINLEEKTKWDDILSNTQAGIRLGSNDGNFTAGFGIRFKMLETNYAYLAETEEGFEDSHQISLILRF